MNYFELFDIPVQLKIDTSLIQKKYLALSKKHHPDFFATGTPLMQAEALEKTALLNKAFQTFKSQEATIAYVLELKNALTPDEKYQLPPDFLMEILEINEQISDAENMSEVEKEGLQNEVSEKENELYEEVREIIENYTDENVSAENLSGIKEYYFKKKYLSRIRQQLAEKQ